MIPLPLFLNNTTNGTCEFWQQLLRWQDSNVHQTKLHFNASVWIKNEGTIFKISDRGVWDGHFFFLTDCDMELRGCLHSVLPGAPYFQTELCSVASDALPFWLPSANNSIFRPLFTQLLLSTFLSKHFGLFFGRTQLSPRPPHSIRGTCSACRTRCMCMLHIVANIELMVINHSIVL